ncbi:TonB-dependent receptor, partial [Mycobacterium tuberculosis]|nr:TonB-dependent receptor [Mycobacterium tuberculosis]
MKEKNFAGYVQANFRGDWWSGNVGLRYVNIKQDIDTYNAVSKAADADVSSLFGMWERLAFQNKRNRVLPSA